MTFKLRFFDCSRDWEKDAPEFLCEIDADSFDEADDLARARFDITPEQLCCCELASE